MTTTHQHQCGLCGAATTNKDEYGVGVHCCDPCRKRENWSYSELADFTHAKQVAVFQWCGCEDNEGNENPYADCPTGKA